MEAQDILYESLWHWSNTTISYAFGAGLESWRPSVERAFDEWSKICGLEFVRVDSLAAAQIDIKPLDQVPAATPGTVGWGWFWGGDGNIESGLIGLTRDLAALPEGTALWLALHEIGHVLGLTHPYGQESGFAGDQSETVMAYNPAPGSPPAQAPAPLDIIAAQALYGPDDLLLGGDGDDRLTAGAGWDWLYGGAGDDACYGNQDGDLIYGNAGADQLFGGQGADTLYGGQGADRLVGGAGADLLQGGRGADVFVFASGCGADVVADFDQDDLLLFPGRDAAEVLASLKEVAGGLLLDLGDGDSVLLAGLDMLGIENFG